MKKYVAKSLRLSTAVLLSVLALGAVTGAEAAVAGRVFSDITGEESAQLEQSIEVDYAPGTTVVGLYIDKAEQLKLSSSLEDALDIKASGGTSYGISAGDSNFSLDVTKGLNINATSNLMNRKTQTDISSFGFAGLNGSSQLTAADLKSIAIIRAADFDSAEQPQFNKANAIGIALSNHQSAINTKGDIYIVGGIVNAGEAETSLQSVGLYAKDNAQVELTSAEGDIRLISEIYNTNCQNMKAFGLRLSNNAQTKLQTEQGGIVITADIAHDENPAGKFFVAGMDLVDKSSAKLVSAKDIIVRAGIFPVSAIQSLAAQAEDTADENYTGEVLGLYSENSKAYLQTDGKIEFEAYISDSKNSNNHIVAVKAVKSEVIFNAKNGIELAAWQYDGDAEIAGQNIYALAADGSSVNLNAESKNIAVTGDMLVQNKSQLMMNGGKIKITGDLTANSSALDFYSDKLNLKGSFKAADSSTADLTAADSINIEGSVAADNASHVELTTNGIVKIAGELNVNKGSLVSISAAKDEISSIDGAVTVNDKSTLKLSGLYLLGETNLSLLSADALAAPANGDLSVDNATLMLDGGMEITGTTKLNNAKVYLYDTQAWQNEFHILSTQKMQLEGATAVYLRADSSKASDAGSYNSDRIFARDIQGDGKLDIMFWDEGMKNGYGMSADGVKQLDNQVILISNNTDAGKYVHSIYRTTYANGIWDYLYTMNGEQKNENFVINNLQVQATPSASQTAMQDANKAAAAMAVTVLGEDEALRAHLRDVREQKESENVWAQYRGGKLKADGAGSDMQVKYNGVEVGYDAYVGNSWSFGVSGQQVRGNTQLGGGSGKVKTNVGSIYGTWQGDGGAYVNLEAKAGRISSESKNFALAGAKHDFSAPAYSLSAEYGRTRELAHDWFVEPALRLSYVHMGASDYSVQTQATTARVANDSFNSLAVRGGAKLGKKLGDRGSFYVQAAGVYDFDGDVTTSVSADGRSARYERALGGWGMEYGAGVDYRLSKAACFNLDVERRSGGELRRDWGVNVGFNYSF